MPKAYEGYRNSLIKKGIKRDKAEEMAAKWFNKKYKGKAHVGKGSD